MDIIQKIEARINKLEITKNNCCLDLRLLVLEFSNHLMQQHISGRSGAEKQQVLNFSKELQQIYHKLSAIQNNIDAYEDSQITEIKDRINTIIVNVKKKQFLL